jgi:LPS-assembly lipoprotein
MKVQHDLIRLSPTFSYVLFVVILSMLLNGCGFKLRGDYLLPDELKILYVSSTDKHGELTRIVKQHLKVNKVNVVEQFAVDIPELRVLKDSLDRRTLSVFPNGQVAAYELIYTVSYQLRFSNEDSQTQSFEFNRDYQDNPNIALAKSRELTLMLSEMRKEAADKILRSLSTIQH